MQLSGYDHLILIDAKAPVSFFAYPGKKSYLVPDDCNLLDLVTKEQDAGSSGSLVARRDRGRPFGSVEDEEVRLRIVLGELFEGAART